MASNKNIQAISKPGKDKIKHYCNRCENDFFSKQSAPKYCGLCKSSLWKQPRKYALIGENEPTRKRTAPTGKAAAKLAPERIKADRLTALQSKQSQSYYEFQRLSAELDLPTGDFRKMYLPGIIYGMERERDTLKEIGFELAKFETSPQDEFFAKRGALYSYKDRIVYALERIEQHFYKEDCDNCFRDSDPASIERYRIFDAGIKTLKIQRDLVMKEITELNQTQPAPIVADQQDDKPGLMVQIELVKGRGCLIKDLNGKTLAGGIPNRRTAVTFIKDKGWLLQPELI